MTMIIIPGKISFKFSATSLLTLASGILMLMWVSSCSFSEARAKKLFQQSKGKVYDIIIVPGVPLENGKWDRTMKARVYWSKFLFEKGIAKNIMYSGSAVYTPYYEGKVMALYAAAIGIPEDHIFIESKAEHSTENIYYGYYKAKQLGFNSIALASDPFQSKQLRSFARRRLGKDVGIIPIVFDTLKAMEPLMTDPTLNFETAYNKNFVSIKKRQSLWKRLKGTLSYNIDKKAYK